MKKIVLVLSVFVMILLTACGTSAAASTQAPAQLAATSVSASSAAGTQVDVTLADNTITASTTTFQAGVPYTFVITNTGKHLHSFNINPPESVIGSLDASLNKALLVVPQEKLRSGASVTVNFTFPQAVVGQLLEFSCLIRSHYEDGMHVDITVTK